MEHQISVHTNLPKKEAVATDKGEQSHQEVINLVPKKNIFNTLASLFLFIGIILFPLFFLPSSLNIPLEAAKVGFLSLVAIGTLLLWLAGRFKDGRIVVPKSIILGGGALVGIAFFISALFSSTFLESFFGLVSEVGTFSSILALILIMVFASIFFQEEGKTTQFYTSMLFLGFILFLYQILRIGMVFDILPQGWLTHIPQNLVGKWSDLAVFFGVVGLLSASAIDLLRGSGRSKIILYAGFAFSLITMFFVNFFIGWMTLGILGLVVLVYALAFRKQEGGPFPIASSVLVGVALLAVVLHGPIGDLVFRTIGIPQETARPSWGETLVVAKDTYGQHALLGSGPNRFNIEWSLFKPEGVNSSLIWAGDFNSGVGLLPTFAVTTGLLGLIALLCFLGAYLYQSGRSLLAEHASRLAHFRVLSTLLSSLFLWVIAFFYIPNTVILALAFFTTGVFVAELVHGGIIKNMRFSITRDPKTGFAATFGLIVVTILAVGWLYAIGTRFVALEYAQKSFVQTQSDTAKELVLKAVDTYPAAIYYRQLSNIDIIKAREVLNDQTLSEDTQRSAFQASARDAIEHALNAKDKNPDNYQNWLILAQTYRILGQVGLPEGYTNAKTSYEEAIKRNPKSPVLPLELARLELDQGNTDGARNYINQALTLKSDYTQAIFLLSQIEASEGNIPEAIKATETASLISPNDTGIFFQLGFLKYKTGDYLGAITALERSVALEPSYSNAKYFLGLSYHQVGRTDDAIAQFKDVARLNPDNQEVQSIIANLEAGRGPFESADGTSSTTKPEDRTAPPISESTSKESN